MGKECAWMIDMATNIGRKKAAIAEIVSQIPYMAKGFKKVDATDEKALLKQSVSAVWPFVSRKKNEPEYTASGAAIGDMKAGAALEAAGRDGKRAILRIVESYYADKTTGTTGFLASDRGNNWKAGLPYTAVAEGKTLKIYRTLQGDEYNPDVKVHALAMLANFENPIKYMEAADDALGRVNALMRGALKDESYSHGVVVARHICLYSKNPRAVAQKLADALEKISGGIDGEDGKARFAKAAVFALAGHAAECRRLGMKHSEIEMLLSSKMDERLWADETASLLAKLDRLYKADPKASRYENGLLALLSTNEKMGATEALRQFEGRLEKTRAREEQVRIHATTSSIVDEHIFRLYELEEKTGVMLG